MGEPAPGRGAAVGKGHLPGVSRAFARPACYSGSLSAQRFCYQFSQGAFQRSRGATPSLGGSTFAVAHCEILMSRLGGGKERTADVAMSSLRRDERKQGPLND
jgi:hypothetical protein